MPRGITAEMFAELHKQDTDQTAGIIRNAVQSLLDAFATQWNKGEVESACSSYAKDAIYLSRRTGERLVGRDAIVKHYLEGYEPGVGPKLKLTVVDLFFNEEIGGTRPQMIFASLQWQMFDGETETASGFAAELYRWNNMTGGLEAIVDVS